MRRRLSRRRGLACGSSRKLGSHTAWNRAQNWPLTPKSRADWLEISDGEKWAQATPVTRERPPVTQKAAWIADSLGAVLLQPEKFTGRGTRILQKALSNNRLGQTSTQRPSYVEAWN